jgi:hypothetical protein
MSEWIKCADRLPDNPFALKLIWVSRLNYGPSYIAMGVYRDGRWDFDDNRLKEVIYWHELPELPKD